MNKERYIILLTDSISGQRWAYGSISAMVKHFENPLDVTTRTVQLHVKKKGGYPVSVDGCVVDRIRLWSVSDIEEDNPAVIDPDHVPAPDGSLHDTEDGALS